MALNLIKKWFIKRSILSDRDDTGVTKSTALDLDAYIQYRIDNTTGIRPYKVYTALLTQTGTNAPVATVLENTLGEIVWTRGGVGGYLGTLANAFTANKTYAVIGSLTTDRGQCINDILRQNDNEVAISTSIFNSVSPSFELIDDELFNTPIEIRVYP